MKNNLPLLISIIAWFTLSPGQISAQGVAINSSGNAPHASAALDVDADDKGVLIPRIPLSSVSDVGTIPSPALYLTVYNTNASMTNGNGEGMYYWNGAQWIFMAVASNGPGTSGQVLTSGGAGVAPSWTTISAGGAPHGKQRFTSNGVFNVPEGVTQVWVSMCGAGGGGGGSNYGGGGGGAQCYLAEPLTLSLSSYAITIGTGGTGGTGSGTDGTNGTDGTATSFGSLLTANGGGGGKSYSLGSGLGGSSGGAGGSMGSGGSNGTGTGGGSLFGSGGPGANNSVTPSHASGYGSGGGGGNYPHGNGGSGAPGFVLVEW